MLLLKDFGSEFVQPSQETSREPEPSTAQEAAQAPEAPESTQSPNRVVTIELMD
jgi:hypothetical protein